jgi:hypothetical protein
MQTNAGEVINDDLKNKIVSSENGTNWKLSGLALNAGIDFVNASHTISDVAFKTVRSWSNHSFNYASRWINSLSDIFPPFELAGKIVKASHKIADVSLAASHLITSIGFSGSSYIMRHVGAKPGEFLRMIVGAEIVDSLALFSTVLTEVNEPIAHLGVLETLECLQLVGRLQEKIISYGAYVEYKPVQKPGYKIDFYFLERIERFAISAYGSILCRAFGLFGENDRIFSDSETIQYFTNIKEDDIIIIEKKSSHFRPRYFVALDHSTSSIVVSFRGTSNIHDALVDLTCRAVEFLGGFVHKGFYDSSLKFDDLKQRLHEIHKQYPSYIIMLTGHSYGAAIATLLAINWKYEFVNQIFCYAYGAPCVISENVDPSCCDNVISVVIGNDFVSRWSLSSTKNICELIVYVHSIGSSRFREMLNRLDNSEKNESEDSSIVDEWASIEHRIAALKKCKHKPLLFPAGRVLWVNPKQDQELACAWIDPKSLNEIIIKDSFAVHLPNYLYFALRALKNDHLETTDDIIYKYI